MKSVPGGRSPAPLQVLIVKLSSLGDVVHALPVIQDMHAGMPGVQIDWVVEEGLAPLLAQVQGLRRVIPVALRRWSRQLWRQPLRCAREIAAFRRALRTTRYDAVIDLQGLTKSAIVSRLARGHRYAMANATLGAGYEAPTRWVADTAIALEPAIHVVERSRVLCAQALGYALPQTMSFGLGRALAPVEPPEVALVHGTSRADKEWPLAHWVDLGRRLNAGGWTVVLPHGSAAELRRSEEIADALRREQGGRARIWPRLPLDALTLELARCAGVIGVDSGLSHIAVALDLPHVQIYNFDTAWRTGPLPLDPARARPRQTSRYALPTPGVDEVWAAWCEVVGLGESVEAGR